VLEEESEGWGGWGCVGAADGFCEGIGAAGGWFSGREGEGGEDMAAGVEGDADGEGREEGETIIRGGVVVGGVGVAVLDRGEESTGRGSWG
jgi:hypothetical protein